MFRACLTVLFITLLTLMFNADSKQDYPSIHAAEITRSEVFEQNSKSFSSYLTEEDTEEITSVIHNAVENNGWMQARDRKELHKILHQYFTGNLLEELTKQTWQFININTDWHGTTNVEKITYKSIDENLVRVLAYIKETDLVGSTNITITGEFVLIKTDNGWRIQQMNVKE